MVSAGEVCTEAKAKELGLLELGAIRTYSETDTSDYTKTEALCRISDNRAKAYPVCALEHGFAFTQVPGDMSRCVTPSCPPGFTSGSNQQCYKPSSSILKDKTKICDEKSYDWYTIPYYHLGNGYRKGNDGKCYEPCPKSYVPLVKEDPVDKGKWEVEFSDDTILTDGSRCVSIDDYFNGDYAGKANTDMEHCPIAVVRRLASSTEGLKEELKANAQENMELLEDQLPSSLRVRVNSKIASEATKVALDTKMNLKNIQAGTTRMKIACGRMVDDGEIGNLHGICKSLKETPSKFFSQWRTDTPNVKDSVLATRRAVMEQACHEVFCNNPENAMIAGGEPICFTPRKVSKEELDEHNSIVEYQNKKLNAFAEGGTGTFTTPKGKLRDSPDTSEFVKKSIKIVLSILLTLLTLLVLFMFGRLFILFFGLAKEKAEAEVRKNLAAAAPGT
jgi:hypothetical protein